MEVGAKENTDRLEEELSTINLGEIDLEMAGNESVEREEIASESTSKREVREEQDDNGTLNLLDLPPEIILQIFIHIDIRTIFKTVILTCKTFHHILTTDGIWKSIFSLKWESTKITKDYDFVKDWKDVYFTYDDIHSFWKRKDKYRLKCKRMDVHFGSIDAVHIMQGGRFAVSGSRDRSAVVWDMQGFAATNEDIGSIEPTATLAGHKGWVWAVTSDPSRSHEVITGSWDNKVKIWNLNNNGENTETFNYHPAAILDAVSYDGLLFTACYDKKIRIFDPRSQDVQELLHHKGAVLSLIVDDNMIISRSDDKTIGVCDRRMTSQRSTTTFNIPFDARVTCMNLAHEQGFSYLRVGLANSKFSIIDTTNQMFTHLESYVWDLSKSVKFANFHGAFIACAPKGLVKVYSPDRGRILLDSYQEHEQDISSVYTRKEIMVTGSCDDTVGFWKFCQI